jgi:hypothetical protein
MFAISETCKSSQQQGTGLATNLGIIQGRCRKAAQQCSCTGSSPDRHVQLLGQSRDRCAKLVELSLVLAGTGSEAVLGSSLPVSGFT